MIKWIARFTISYVIRAQYDMILIVSNVSLQKGPRFLCYRDGKLLNI